MSDPYVPKIDFIVFINILFYSLFWGEIWLGCFLTGFVRFILTRMSPFRSRPGSMVMQILVWLSPWTLLQTSVRHTTVNHKKNTLNTNISLNLSMHGCQTLYLHLTSLLMHSCSLRACRKLQRPGSVMYGKSTCGLLWVCVIQKPPRHRGSPVIGRLEGWATCQGSMSNTV